MNNFLRFLSTSKQSETFAQRRVGVERWNLNKNQYSDFCSSLLRIQLH